VCSVQVFLSRFDLQVLELNECNTKALFRRAQAWQGLKDLEQAMVGTSPITCTVQTGLDSSWSRPV